MIIYLTGLSARNIKLKEIEKEYTNIKRYESNISADFNAFIDDISNVSIFPIKELIVLQNTEKLKNFDSLIRNLEKFKDDNKTVVIDYFYEYKKNNPHLKVFENMGAEIINIVDDDHIIEKYICDELNIKKLEAKKLISLIGKNYYHVKNEIYKYKNFLDGKKYDINEIKNLIHIDEERHLKNYIDKIHSLQFNIEKLPANMYIPLIYSIYSEFEILHKLNILDLSLNHDEFKKQYNVYAKYFNNANYYSIYLKNKSNNYSKYKCFKIIRKCIEVEQAIKTSLYDTKTALWLLIKEIYA